MRVLVWLVINTYMILLLLTTPALLPLVWADRLLHGLKSDLINVLNECSVENTHLGLVVSMALSDRD